MKKTIARDSGINRIKEFVRFRPLFDMSKIPKPIKGKDQNGMDKSCFFNFV